MHLHVVCIAVLLSCHCPVVLLSCCLVAIEHALTSNSSVICVLFDSSPRNCRVLVVTLDKLENTHVAAALSVVCNHVTVAPRGRRTGNGAHHNVPPLGEVAQCSHDNQRVRLTPIRQPRRTPRTQDLHRDGQTPTTPARDTGIGIRGNAHKPCGSPATSVQSCADH